MTISGDFSFSAEDSNSVVHECSGTKSTTLLSGSAKLITVDEDLNLACKRRGVAESAVQCHFKQRGALSMNVPWDFIRAEATSIALYNAANLVPR